MPSTRTSKDILFERSKFLIATSRKKDLCVCRVSCVVFTANNLGFKGVVKTLLLSHAMTGGVQKGSVNSIS